MSKNRKRTAAQEPEDVRIQEFLDMIAPSVVKFNADHFICGNTYRCVWGLREYPTATDEQAILRHLGASTPAMSHLLRKRKSSATPPTKTA